MNFRLKGKTIFQYSYKRLLYTLCFAFFCLIDQRIKTGTGLDGWIETFRDSTGIIMAILILSHYKWDDIKRHKLPFVIWSALSIIGGVAAFVWGMGNRPFLNDWAVVILDVILYGFVLIHTVIAIVIDKKYPKLDKKLGAVWLVMMLLMVVSKSKQIWPLTYLIMFGCFYLTDYSEEEQKDMFQGILDGIILSFFLFQGFCCVFRPYDAYFKRYVGIYSNPNLNALYYLEVLVAVFAKLLYVYRIQSAKWIRIYYWLGAGVVCSFLFMTIGRTAWIVAFFLGLLFLWFMQSVQARKRFILNGLILVLCACLMFPVSFGLTRYMPPVFHHPIWFWGEWHDWKVHSWDPWNSEKFVDMDEFLDAAVGRIIGSLVNISDHSEDTDASNATQNGQTVTEAAASNDTGSDTLTSQTTTVTNATLSSANTEATNSGVLVDENKPKDPREEAALIASEQEEDSLLVRSIIYTKFAQQLSLFGRADAYGFQLTPTYWIGHAHNIYLQYGTDFGVPVMLLFITLILWSVGRFAKRFRRNPSEVSSGYLLFILVPALFGLFEYAWGVGSITILMLFVAVRAAITSQDS